VKLMAPSAGTVRLRNDRDNGMTGRDQRLERRGRERGRPEEHDAERIYHLPDFLSFWIFLTIMSRLMPRSRSMKTMPSR
jgi:hypothetical protein